MTIPKKHHRTTSAIALGFLVLLICAWLPLSAHEGEHPSYDELPAGLGEIGPKEETATTYFLTSRRLTDHDIGAFAGEMIDPLMKQAKALGLEVIGPITFIFHDRPIVGALGEAAIFRMDLAIPVYEAKGTPPKTFSFRKEPDFSCISATYKGPTSKLLDAWTALRAAPANQGHPASGQDREVFLNWEAPESPNNVIDLQHGVR